MTIPLYGANPIVAGVSNADVLRGVLEELKEILNGNVDDTNLAAAAITAVKLAEKIITTDKIAANVVNNVKVGAGAARLNKIDKFEQTQAVAGGGTTNFDHGKGSLFMFACLMFTDSTPATGTAVWGEVDAAGNRIVVHNTDVVAHNIKVVVF